MKLKECEIGKVIINKSGRIGHITGMGLNASTEIIVIVKFADSEIHELVHQKNLSKYKGDL